MRYDEVRGDEIRRGAASPHHLEGYEERSYSCCRAYRFAVASERVHEEAREHRVAIRHDLLLLAARTRRQVRQRLQQCTTGSVNLWNYQLLYAQLSVVSFCAYFVHRGSSPVSRLSACVLQETINYTRT